MLFLGCAVSAQAQLLSNGRPANWTGTYDAERCRMLFDQSHDWQALRDKMQTQEGYKSANDTASDTMNEYNYKCH